MDFLQIERHRLGALSAEGLVQNVRRDERIAVAVATDPTANAQERRDRRLGRSGLDRRQAVLEFGVEAGQLAKERIIEIGHAVGHFVQDIQTNLAQQVGLPQHQHIAAQRVVDLRKSSAVQMPFSRRVSNAATATSRCMVLLRRTSVGCAVSTGET